MRYQEVHIKAVCNHYDYVNWLFTINLHYDTHQYKELITEKNLHVEDFLIQKDI